MCKKTTVEVDPNSIERMQAYSYELAAELRGIAGLIIERTGAQVSGFGFGNTPIHPKDVYSLVDDVLSLLLAAQEEKKKALSDQKRAIMSLVDCIDKLFDVSDGIAGLGDDGNTVRWEDLYQTELVGPWLLDAMDDARKLLCVDQREIPPKPKVAPVRIITESGKRKQ